MKRMYIYFMSNSSNSVIYIGLTNNLERRVKEHKSGLVKGFTSRYNCKKLVYFEIHNSPEAAILREKQLKGGSRKQKNILVNDQNSSWKDLSLDWD